MAFEDKRVTLIFENDEYEILKALAEKSGLDVPEFIKNFIDITISNLKSLVKVDSTVVDELRGSGIATHDSPVQ